MVARGPNSLLATQKSTLSSASNHSISFSNDKECVLRDLVREFYLAALR
jgi:hypothetical protein